MRKNAGKDIAESLTIEDTWTVGAVAAVSFLQIAEDAKYVGYSRRVKHAHLDTYLHE